MRCVFTRNMHYPPLSRPTCDGEECVITDYGINSSLWVQWGDGRQSPVLPSELTPISDSELRAVSSPETP
jgi:hypothetical protein